jgi:hypothetical protein
VVEGHHRLSRQPDGCRLLAGKLARGGEFQHPLFRVHDHRARRPSFAAYEADRLEEVALRYLADSRLYAGRPAGKRGVLEYELGVIAGGAINEGA